MFSSCSLAYINRFLFWNFSDINDYIKFPYQNVSCDNSFFTFIKDIAKESHTLDLLKTVDYQYKNRKIRCSIDELLTSTGTKAFIIIRDDTVLYEKYFNKYVRESFNTSFSMAKSFTSALIGIAIDEGFIKSIDDYVVDYIPELKNKICGTLALKHLLNMSSGTRYNPAYYPWADEPKSYYYPDLKKLVLKSTKQEYQPGLYFKYSNFNTILLGIILGRATMTPPYEYLQEKIWKPIGMEFSATWSVDSKQNKFEKMESGINARSIDFAKFGRLFLNSGRWGNKQIISENWVNESTCPMDLNDEQYYFFKNYYPYSTFFDDKQLYYKYGWWGIKQNAEHYDYMAIGHLGQFIYVCPQKRIIIVRNGSGWGKINWWPMLFKKITEKF
jgi:hypothetical protein